MPTGVVRVILGESRIDETLLAIKGGVPNPQSAATNFLANLNLINRRVTVTGSDGFLGNLPVFFMTNAVLAPTQALAFDLAGGAAKPARKAAAKKGGKKGGAKKSTKKSAKKAAAKKSAGKAGG